jgi:hypothetical protein
MFFYLMTGLLVFSTNSTATGNINIMYQLEARATARCQRIQIPHFGDQNISLATRFSKAFDTAA